MGLDMYLKGNVYIGAHYEHNEVEGNVKITKQGRAIEVPFRKLHTIQLLLGYWRKANAVHGYIVDKYGNGDDDCHDIYMNRQDLQELLNDCKKVIASPDQAETTLPTTEGFFFGSYEYDDYYFEYIKDTIGILEDALSLDINDYIYQASW